MSKKIIKYNFGNPTEPDTCYACGCLDFDEDWEYEPVGGGYQTITCANCGRQQGWWYEKEYLKEQEKKKDSLKLLNKIMGNYWLSIMDNFVKGVK